MTKKDYNAIAYAIAMSTRDDNDNLVNADELIERLSVAFKADNERFNSELFNDACHWSYWLERRRPQS